MSAVDPHELYALLAREKMHPRKAKGLEIVHEICKQRFNAKATEWGVNSIGRESAARGGPGAPTMHQPRQEYYRALIKAWHDYACAKHPAEKRKSNTKVDDWIQAIANVASRQLVYGLKSDLARAEDEIRLLKKLVPREIEIRAPVVQQVDASRPSIAVSAVQVRSVKRFVSGPLSNSEQLKGMGLRLTKKGDVVSDSTGEVVLEGSVLELLRAASIL